MDITKNQVPDQNQGSTGAPGNFGYRRPITPRSIVLCIIFTLCTCGIYGIYWSICLTDEVNQMSGRLSDPSGGLCFVFSLCTCGIYGIYWAYKMGEKCDIINGREYGDSKLIFLLLSIFGLCIINYALIQDTLNKHCY